MCTFRNIWMQPIIGKQTIFLENISSPKKLIYLTPKWTERYILIFLVSTIQLKKR